MKKKDYIEKYGEEAYKKHLERNNKYYESHREEIKDSNRKYREKHLEELKAWRKKYYQEHKEAVKDCNRKYREKHIEEVKEWTKKYNQEHLEDINKHNRHYYSTPEGRASNLISAYRRRDRESCLGECTITQGWMVENIFASSCVYCGESDWRKLGCDRIDNTKAHTPDNVVCACWSCNSQRKSMSVEEFKLKKQQELNSCAKVLPPAAS